MTDHLLSDFININDTIPYSLKEIFNPRARNDRGVGINYNERKKYKNVPYFLEIPNPLDSWYDKNYFGRVDPIQNGIIVKNSTTQIYLRQIESKQKNVFVLNFVSDAFTGLRNHLNAVAATMPGQFSDTFYQNIEPSKGLADPWPQRKNLVRTIRGRYANRIGTSATKSKKVVDFQSYVKHLLDFYESGILKNPLTLSGFAASRFSSPMMSGLSIELAKVPHDVDYNKVNKFIMDPTFRYFVKAARKYGFYVDRNAPWKITADPFSPPMLYYLGLRFVHKDRFFDHYYDRTHSLDLSSLQKDLVDMYNKFVQKYPVISESSPVLGGFDTGTRCRDLVPQKEYRRSITISAAEGLGDIYWLDTYFKFRVKEAQLSFEDYDKKLKMAIDIHRIYDMEKAIRFINNEIKPYLYNMNAMRKGLTHINTRGNIIHVLPELNVTLTGTPTLPGYSVEPAPFDANLLWP
jgi:hypothetical protein